MIQRLLALRQAIIDTHSCKEHGVYGSILQENSVVKIRKVLSFNEAEKEKMVLEGFVRAKQSSGTSSSTGEKQKSIVKMIVAY